jgi:hypothetical protein
VQEGEERDLKDDTLNMIDVKVAYFGEKITAEMSMEVDGGFAEEEGDCNDPKILGVFRGGGELY